MKIEKYLEITDIWTKVEIEKLVYLCFYHFKVNNKSEFVRSDIAQWFYEFHLGSPNLSRLLRNVKKSRYFIKGKVEDSFRLHANKIKELEQEIPNITENETIDHQGSLLPKSLYENTRGYIIKIGDQINSSYENKIFDGCSVLMRRLIEILLIHAYQKSSIEDEVRDSSGSYNELKYIIDNAKKSKVLNLSKGTKECLEEFRILGNLSAHKIFYNCRKDELDKVAKDFRVVVEELLYKSGLI